jgi:hypothetical protein
MEIRRRLSQGEQNSRDMHIKVKVVIVKESWSISKADFVKGFRSR